MKSLGLTSCLASLCACSAESAPKHTEESLSAFPTAVFDLACRAVANASDPNLNRPFKIEVDPARGTYEMPGAEAKNFARISPETLVLVDERGPQTRTLTFELQRGELVSRTYGTIVPINELYRTKCEVKAA